MDSACLPVQPVKSSEGAGEARGGVRVPPPVALSLAMASHSNTDARPLHVLSRSQSPSLEIFVCCGIEHIHKVSICGDCEPVVKQPTSTNRYTGNLEPLVRNSLLRISISS